MGTGRWKLTLVEEAERLPVRWRRPRRQPERSRPRGEQAAAALLSAVDLLGRRSEGPEAWAAPLSSDPIAFLLDSTADAINVWAGGAIVYRNRGAERLGLGRSEFADLERIQAGGRQLERRCLRFRRGDGEYVLELISEVR